MTEITLSYRPDRFGKTFRAFDGLALWHWLQQPENITIMTTASFLHRPAVEPLAPRLADRFPAVMHIHSVRQMIGHMVRQIMQEQGYHLDRSNVKIDRRDSLFRRGSTYCST
ncbi:MAG: hypothetical protein AAF393_07680 [Pseudomonadota bacterium]